MKNIEVKFEKIVPEGKALAKINGKVVFVLGAFPGEKAIIEITKDKKNYFEAYTVEITKSSKHRIKPRENHYLCCSPWQAIDYNYQIELKKQILTDVFSDLAKTSVKVSNFYQSQDIFGYRTKLEFSFTCENNKLYLAFNKRGSYRKKVVLKSGCVLGSEKMNNVALEITKLLNAYKIEAWQLKSLTVRESKTHGKVVAVLLFYKKDAIISKIDFDSCKIADSLIVAISSPRSPVSSIDDIVYKKGNDLLEEEFLEKKFYYPVDGFFQNNLPVYEKAILEIKKNVIGKNILELYSGVGTIGLNIIEKGQKYFAYESVKSATDYSKINAKTNKIENYDTINDVVEKTDFNNLGKIDTVILDPPRSGLHPKVIEKLLLLGAKRIVYLSCNPITQARDFNLLKNDYCINDLVGFDFYPHTPHLESLLVLDKI